MMFIMIVYTYNFLFFGLISSFYISGHEVSKLFLSINFSGIVGNLKKYSAIRLILTCDSSFFLRRRHFF